MGSIPVGDSRFSLFHARVMLISSLFSCLVTGSQVHAAVKGRAFQKLLEISQKVARNFSKKCSKVVGESQKLLFVTKAAQKKLFFVALFLCMV